MNPTEDNPTVDPLAHTRQALAALPPNPADVSSEHLHILAEVHQDLHALIAVAAESMRQLGLRVLADEADRISVEDYLLPQALTRRCELAEHELTTYSVAALQARGFTPTGAPGH
jgi:hypothetical protein